MVAVQVLLQLLRDALQLIGTTLAITGYLWPETTIVRNCTSYDYIVVGAGTAGCIIADRLAEDEDVQVLVIEAGGDPSFESVLTGLFTLLPRSTHDWRYKSVYHPDIAQYTVNKAIELTAGKMLGGTSSLNHGIRARSHPKDFNDWADIIDDDAWNYENLHPYLIKPENLVDKKLIESNYSQFYGTGGYVTLTRHHEKATERYLDAFREVGNKRTKEMKRLGLLGYKEPVFYISDKNGARQSTALTYLSGIRDGHKHFNKKPNLHVMKYSEVTEIIIDGNKNARGVVARNESGKFRICAKQEIIISAGAFNSPKILLQSGIGPKEDLEILGIDVISDLPVGENLQDHATVLFGFKMGASNRTKARIDPHRYPIPVIIGYDTISRTKEVPEFEATCLIFEHDSNQIPLLTSAAFNFIEDIGQTFDNANIGHEVFLTFLSLLHPMSRGKVKLDNKNSTGAPLVYLNTLSEEKDLNNMARYLKNFMQIRESSFFQRVGAEFIDLDIGCGSMNNTLKYWKCHAKALCNTCWQYCGTCSLGTVVDTNLKVIGVGRLRVADASIIPKITSGFLSPAVMGIAEKAAALIKKDQRDKKDHKHKQ